MAKESFTAQLAAKPLSHQVGILLGTMLALGLFYYQFFYSTLDEDLQTAKSGNVAAEQRNDELKVRQQEWAEMVTAKEELDIQLSTNQVSLPETADLASFIGHMQRQAAVAGVSFRNWSRLKEEVLPAYVKVPISIEVVGSFHQILKYFHLLGKTKRIITVEDFALTEDKGALADDVLLKATFRASTFRQPDGAAGAGQAAAQDPNSASMKDKMRDARATREGQVEAVAGGKTDEQGNPVPDGKSGTDRLKNPGAN
jgi:type IV pilus assembly protein PilO